MKGYPGCQVVVLKDGREMYNKAFGTHVWNEAGSKALPVKKTDVYDIASLTKTTATLLAVMKLYDGGRSILQTGCRIICLSYRIRTRRILRYANC